jgi:hypothetical protein
MKVNLTEIAAFDDNTITVDLFDLYPYPIDALDIYFDCENILTHDKLLSVGHNGYAMIMVSIGNQTFEIRSGLPGESSTNPITYHVTMETMETGYVEVPKEVNSNHEPTIYGKESSYAVPLRIKFIINDEINIDLRRVAFGGVDNDLKAIEGFGGVNPTGNVSISGFGGLTPNLDLQGAIFVIQKSLFYDAGANYGVKY